MNAEYSLQYRTGPQIEDAIALPHYIEAPSSSFDKPHPTGPR